LGLKQILLIICVVLLVITGCVLGGFTQKTTDMTSDPVNYTFKYILYGHPDEINITLYKGVYIYFSKRDTQLYVGYEKDTYTEVITNPEQEYYMKNILDAIKAKSNNTEDQARIAINLVQRMNYTVEDEYRVAYPYEVLYRNGGVCSERSILLAYLLKNIGYDTVLMGFRNENHMAVGIKTKPVYTYKNTGYAFIETTNTNIITYSDGSYPNPKLELYAEQNIPPEDYPEGYANTTVKLESTPELIPVSSGMEFNNLSKDYADAWNYTDLGSTPNGTVSPSNYNQWQFINWYYGLHYGDGFITYNPLNPITT